MRRSKLTREQKIEDLVAAWEGLTRRQKSAILETSPELYGACAWLAAGEIVRRDGR